MSTPDNLPGLGLKSLAMLAAAGHAPDHGRLLPWRFVLVPQEARAALADGRLVDLAPGRWLPIQLYWHCWNLDSPLLDRLTRAVIAAADTALRRT